MKNFNFWALSLTAITLAGCTSEDDLVVQAPPTVNEGTELPIMFTSSQKGFTRTDFTGAEAAGKLGNKFVVSGYKGPQTAWDNSKNTIVFDNYVVKYTANTANTTESNSANWEYVLANQEKENDNIPIKHAKDNGITRQSIKYWDYTQKQYDFIAWSTGSKTAIYEGTANEGQVLVSAITYKTATGATGKAYTFTGKAADLSECYISDLVTVKKKGKGEDKYGVADYPYNSPVTLKFRQLGTKVRIGLYETIPGYSVKNVKFYTTGDLLQKTGDVLNPGQIVDNATIFSAGSDIYTEGVYTVYFPTVDSPDNADNNQAHIRFASKEGVSQTTQVDLGTMNYTYRESGEKSPQAVYLGRASNEASYAGKADDNYYVVYLPNETGSNLNLRINFTLESIDGSGETIEVKNAKAQVPSIYTTWKPGFAYTYLFKISDNTNGRTGVYDPTESDDATINSDPAGLYPITFDAVVVNAEDGDQTQETITTIATPSITTYQQKSTVVNADEYTVNGKDIFVTVSTNEKPGALIAMNTNAATVGGAALYTIPAGMTEADVIDALAYQDTDYADDADDNTIKGRSGKVLTKVQNVSSETTLGSNQWKLTNTVEFGANGNPITVNANEAARFIPTANTTYAFVYTEKAADAEKNKDIYEPIKFEDVSTFTGKKYRYAYKATEATYNNGTLDNNEDDFFDAQKGHVYFTATGAEPSLVYTKVANPFIGQGVSNLYTRSGAGTTESPYVYTKESGYAVSGTTYYYTTNGINYLEAHPVPYAANCAVGFFEYNAETGEYTPTTATTPVDGVAYYQRTGSEGSYVYTYCVFLPQQVKNMWEVDPTKEKVEATETTPVEGQTYFDKYSYDSAVRYAKVIKVQ